MIRLPELQRAFQAHVLSGDPAIRHEIVGTARVDADTRLRIYADGYRLRLIEALDTDYPGLHVLAGDEAFDTLARAYIDAHPSPYRSLRWYGGQMPGFLRATAPWSDYPVFADMAAFEWAMSEVFDAENGSIASVADMATVPADRWPSLTFSVHPAVRRIDLHWNVPAVWKAIDRDEEPPALEEQNFPVAWLLWRQDLVTRFRSLRVDEAWALAALAHGETFAALCEGLTEWMDAEHVAVHAAGLLKQWLTDGLIRAVHVP